MSCTRRNPGPTVPAYGLTMGLRISSAVKAALSNTWRSVRPSEGVSTFRDLTDPPPNWSGQHFPQHLQTLSCLSHMLSVNLHLSVGRAGRRWQICQFWCSLANTNQCLAVSTDPTCRHLALVKSVSDSLDKTCMCVACRRSFCKALTLPHLFLVQRSR